MNDNYWIQTYLNRRVPISLPHPEEIDIEDIAHALSMLCRFNGHVKAFYSIAQHSVFVAEHCRRQDARVLALLHDAPKAYLGVLPRPVNRYLEKPLEQLEESFHRAITHRLVPRGPLTRYYDKPPQKLGLRERIDIGLAIEEADLLALSTERRDVLTERPNWDLQLPEPSDDRIWPLPPAAAKELFLESYYAITEPTKGTAA